MDAIKAEVRPPQQEKAVPQVQQEKKVGFVNKAAEKVFSFLKSNEAKTNANPDQVIAAIANGQIDKSTPDLSNLQDLEKSANENLSLFNKSMKFITHKISEPGFGLVATSVAIFALDKLGMGGSGVIDAATASGALGLASMGLKNENRLTGLASAAALAVAGGMAPEAVHAIASGIDHVGGPGFIKAGLNNLAEGVGLVDDGVVLASVAKDIPGAVVRGALRSPEALNKGRESLHGFISEKTRSEKQYLRQSRERMNKRPRRESSRFVARSQPIAVKA